MNDSELRELIERARRVAERVGPMHALWDVISDAEDILAGRPARLSRDQIEALLTHLP